jgi:predicted nucleic acid-binding protein
MSSLIFPAVNVWLALAAPEHVHASVACRWWEQETGRIVFSRFTQMALLRWVTTATAKDGKPLTMTQAWRVYDRLYEDDRVGFVAEPTEVEARFRECTAARTASPKLWADHGCWPSRRPRKERWSPSTGRWPHVAPAACAGR